LKILPRSKFFNLLIFKMKNTILLICCAVLALSPACTNNAKEMERQSKIEANKALAKKWILEGWNQNRNREVIADVFAQNWKDGNPTFPDQPAGIEGAMYFVDAYRKVFSDIQFIFTHIIAEEDFVTFRCIIEATHQGEFLGIPPTGKRVKFSGIVIHRIENGRFAESWNEIDLLGIQMQLMTK